MASVALAAGLPAAAHANAVSGISGDISVEAGYNTVGQETFTYTETGGYSNSWNNGYRYGGVSVDLNGSVALPITKSIGAQIDLGLDHNIAHPTGHWCTYAYECGATKLDATDVAVHLFTRKPSLGLVGVFAQRTSTTNTNYSGYAGATYYFGGEAQLYVGKLTISGQVSAHHTDYQYYKDRGIQTAGRLTYYVNPHFALTAKAGYEYSDYFGRWYQYYSYSDIETYPSHAWNVGVKAEHQLGHSNVSLLARYDYYGFVSSDTYTESNGSYTWRYNYPYHASRVLVGVKVHLGKHVSLEERDRNGAGLDAVDTTFQELRSLGNNYED
ncbi:MAG TPA: hypothetical protein VFF98_00425 [Novosphingobium sp.]|nr:hypothetical protein [Novosphingobium sp.]